MEIGIIPFTGAGNRSSDLDEWFMDRELSVPSSRERNSPLTNLMHHTELYLCCREDFSYGIRKAFQASNR